MNPQLVRKYNVPGPRYTSYPTVPYWDDSGFSLRLWKSLLQEAISNDLETEGISLYLHLPFCESMCTFCGCTKRITKNHDVEIPYIKALLKELDLYVEVFGKKPLVKEIHLGGGTPTFFTAENLSTLMEGLYRRIRKDEQIELSFEGHPNNTTKEHLQTLFEFGFRKVSFGVQDYNLEVQMAINRIQPFESVKDVTSIAREIGYDSVCHDIIFGLPFQKKEHIIKTIELTNELRPDRIAFYSYAHIPWMKGNGQRGFKEEHLPTGEEKRELYEIGKELLENAGYVEIGMDHFSLPTDELYEAQKQGRIHRNFMGYTATKTHRLIGLGLSAISDGWSAFAQNVKGLEEYLHLVQNDVLPVFRGHILNKEDLIIRQHILNLMCRFETSWEATEMVFEELPDVLIQLKEFEKDELITINSKSILVTEKGKPFVRTVCMAFDLRLQRNKPDRQLFSMTV